jgi:hypothetical protein
MGTGFTHSFESQATNGSKAHCNVSPELPPICNSVAASEKCGNKSPRRTQENEIVHILGENLKKGSVDVLLFGHQVPSPRGPISLALRSEASVVPIYLVRNYAGDMNPSWSLRSNSYGAVL